MCDLKYGGVQSQFVKFFSPTKYGKVYNHKLGNAAVDFHISKVVLRQAPWLNADIIG